MLPPIVLCEGVEDKKFLEKLIETRHIGGFDFHPRCGGNTIFGETLRGLRVNRKIEERKSIIIVADNDGNPAESFIHIQQEITSAGCIIPERPRQATQQDNMPPLYVVMIPWDDDAGCLETLCLSAAEKCNPSALKCVDGLIECVGGNTWDVAKRGKLRMRCYLSSACKSDPNTSLQYAWSRPEALIPIDDSCFNRIAEYLASLAL